MLRDEISLSIVQVYRFIDSGRHAGRDRKQRQKALEFLGRQYQVGTRFLGYKLWPVLTRGFAQQDPVFDNLRNISRRNCSKTYEKDRRQQPLPINATGYMFVEKENFFLNFLNLFSNSCIIALRMYITVLASL